MVLVVDDYIHKQLNVSAATYYAIMALYTFESTSHMITYNVCTLVLLFNATIVIFAQTGISPFDNG